jgi:CheY-like chemotaxis protein
MDRDAVGRAMEVFLVEDNLTDARVAIEALNTGGVRCRVTLVCDGEEAMRFLRRESIFARAPRPDLILLDMELPKKDGREVLAEIRGDESLREIPVIVLTASLVHRVVLEAQQLQVDAYMTKPVSLEKFIDTVKSLRRSWLSELVLHSDA